MPFLLYSYLLSEILAPFFAALSILTGVLFTGRLMQVVDMIFALNIGWADFVRLSVYLLPNLMLFAIPMACTLAVIIAFSRMAAHNEIIAMKAAGVGLNRMLPPVIAFGLCAALLAAYCSIALIPAGSLNLKNLFIKLTTEKISQGVPAGRFTEGTGNMVLYVDKIDPDDHTWRGVYISDMRDPDNPVTVLAAHGALAPHPEQLYVSIELQNGTIHHNDGETTQTISFSDYTINLPIPQPKFIAEDATHGRGKNTLKFSELLPYAEKYGKNSKKGIMLTVEYHLRLALPVGCLIMSLMAMPLAMLSRPGRRNFGIPLGLLFFVLYYIAVTAAKGYCDKPGANIGLAMWLPNMVFGAAAVVVFTITAREQWGALFGRRG